MSMINPITPPPELVSEWTRNRGYSCPSKLWNYIATQAAQWGADQELEACCHEVQNIYSGGHLLRAARRPKPPSDKELALKALASIERTADAPVPTNKESLSLIRRALEQLPDAL